MIPTSSIWGRRWISLASSTACSTVWTGERFGPTFNLPPSGHHPASTSMQTRTGAGAGPEHRLDQVEVLGAIDHQHRRPLRVGGALHGELRERFGVRGRIGDHHVVEAVIGQPQGLGQRVGQQPSEALVAGEDPLQNRAAANRLRCDSYRLAACAAQHVLGVGPHRVEIDEGEWGLDLGEDLLVARVRLIRDGHGASLHRPIRQAMAAWPDMPRRVTPIIDLRPERWPSG